MSELFSSGQARNLFIYGKPGTGKTLCIKYQYWYVKHLVENKIK
jgi:Cdc6-like AAA superfamily ATPase